MQSTEILELSKQIKEKLKEVDAFGNTSFAMLRGFLTPMFHPFE